MQAEQIKTAPVLNLKENGVFSDVSIPFLYQKRGGLMMVLRPRMVLGDDVGLGKTLEAILAMSYFKARNPNVKFLVMTESTAYKQWVKELAWLAPDLRAKIITAKTHVDVQSRIQAFRTFDADVMVTSYSMIYDYRKYIKMGMGKEWVYFADEPDLFKNTESAMHIGAQDLVNGPGGPQRAYGLTATILGNRLQEAYAILQVIAPGTFVSILQFEKDYCRFKKRGGRKHLVGYKNIDRFREQIEPVYYGRLQDDPEVEQDLPEAIPKDVEIELSVEQSWKVVEALDRIIEMPEGEVKQLLPLPAMTMAQQLTNDPRLKGFDIVGAKTEALLETLKGNLAGQRVLVYSRYKSAINLLQAELKKVKLECTRITGDETPDQREEAKARFMSDGEDHIPIMLINKAGQRAWNGQKGAHIIFYDLPWGYDAYRQAIGRIKRTGSTHAKIGVWRFLAVLHPDVAKQVGTDQTIDHHTLSILMKKFALWKAVTGDVIEIDTSDADAREIYNAIKQSYRGTHNVPESEV